MGFLKSAWKALETLLPHFHGAATLPAVAGGFKVAIALTVHPWRTQFTGAVIGLHRVRIERPSRTWELTGHSGASRTVVTMLAGLVGVVSGVGWTIVTCEMQGNTIHAMQ